MALAVTGLGIGLLASVGVSQLLGAVFPDGGGPAGDGRIDLLAFPIVAAAVLAVTLVALVRAGAPRLACEPHGGAAS